MYNELKVAKNIWKNLKLQSFIWRYYTLKKKKKILEKFYVEFEWQLWYSDLPNVLHFTSKTVKEYNCLMFVKQLYKNLSYVRW